MIKKLRLSRSALIVVFPLLVVMAMSGCGTGPVREPEPEPAAEVVSEAAVRAEEEARRRDAKQEHINRLLNAAEAARRDNRLTLPEHDNAYDRYAAVLLLDPDNREARAGLDSILLTYVELIRAAVRSNNTAAARQHQRQAESYFGDNPLLRETASAIAEAEERARRQLERLSGQELQGQEFELPPAELSRRGEEIVDFLAKVGRRLQDTDESVLIHARSDAEGRWIYRQMNEAVPGYRIRGDIRVSSRPALKLMPPL